MLYVSTETLTHGLLMASAVGHTGDRGLASAVSSAHCCNLSAVYCTCCEVCALSMIYGGPKPLQRVRTKHTHRGSSLGEWRVASPAGQSAILLHFTSGFCA